MTRRGYGLLGLAGLGLAAVAWQVRPPRLPQETPAAVERTARSGPTLYCEFTNFADRNPRVGFYFAILRDRQPPVYAQVFRRERDGTQADDGGEGSPRPEWDYDGSESPAVLRAPDDDTVINLYDDDPRQRGTKWFEAGLRSIRYLNLGGRCRRSAA